MIKVLIRLSICLISLFLVAPLHALQYVVCDHQEAFNLLQSIVDKNDTVSHVTSPRCNACHASHVPFQKLAQADIVVHSNPKLRKKMPESKQIYIDPWLKFKGDSLKRFLEEMVLSREMTANNKG